MATRAKSNKPATSTEGGAHSPDQRRALIAEAAYLRAEARFFAPGFEESDWLAAEAEIDRKLTSSPPVAAISPDTAAPPPLATKPARRKAKSKSEPKA